jgi:hypothetical protein
MDSLDELPLKEIIELYYEKHHAMQHGNLEKLIELKNKFPELFIKEKDQEIQKIISYAKQFQKTERYKQLLKMKLKEKLALIKNQSLEGE